MVERKTSTGIDYGMGQTNIDHETGIRFGVISQNEVLQVWADSSEAYYGEPTCPKCWGEVVEIPGHAESSDPPGQRVSVIQDVPDEYEGYEENGVPDFACEICRYLFQSCEAFGDEPLGYLYEKGGYSASCGEDGDIFIEKSPYFTRAAFCSPCAPGACYLMSPYQIDAVNQDLIDRYGGPERYGLKVDYNACAEAAGYPKAYCFGHDWFEGGKAPYPVYSVETGEEVKS